MANGNFCEVHLDLDGKRIKEEIETRVRNELVEFVKKEIRDAIFGPSYSYSYSKGKPQSWVMDFIKDIIRDHKNELIERGAAVLADSMRHSKPVREAFVDVLADNLADE